MKELNYTLKLTAATLLATTSSVAALAKPATTQRPNVLMIIVDDYGYYDLSLTGSALYETPRIDELANSSTSFSNGYVAYPRSVPSRYSIMTGLHCARPQEKSRNDERHVESTNFSIAEPFKAAGYNTYICGKWHLNGRDGSTPADKGFDTVVGAGAAGATSTHFAPFNQKIKEGGKEKAIQGMDDAPEGTYLTDYMSEITASYIKNQSQDKPFFAICSYYAVHTPLEAKEEMVDKYRGKVKSLGLKEDPMKKEEAGDTKTQQDNPTYAAMIESTDSGVGLMIDALKEAGLYDNTIIVFVSDHGGLSNRGGKRQVATTNLPLKAGKGHLYEGGIRVPLFVRLPEQTKGRKSEQVASSLDIAPTLLDLCKLEASEGTQFDGVKLTPALNPKKEGSIESRDLYWHKADERPSSTGDYASSAIRSGKYKLLDFYKQGRVELYDLSQDEGEQRNIAKENPAVTAQLMAKIESWRKEIGAIIKKDK